MTGYSSRNFALELTALIEKGQLEGVINPNQGDQYTLIQTEEYPDNQLPKQAVLLAAIGVGDVVSMKAEEIIDPDAIEERINRYLEEN